MTTLITIPLPCTLEHLLGDQVLPLATGPLALLTPTGVHLPRAPTAQEIAESGLAASIEPEEVTVKHSDKDESETVCVLTVGSAAFPVTKSTPFGTTNDAFTYLFKPVLPGLPSGIVRLILPSSTSQAFPTASQPVSSPDSIDSKPELIKLRDAFEQVLIDLKILTNNVLLATFDDVGRSAEEGLRGMAVKIDNRVDNKIATTDKVAPNEETQIPSGIHRLAEGTENAAVGVRSIAASLTEGLQKGSAWVGNQIGQRIPVGQSAAATEEKNSQPKADEFSSVDLSGDSGRTGWETTKESISAVAGGLVSGSSALASHASQGTQDSLKHSSGEESAALAKNVTNAGAAVTGTATDVVVNTSSAVLGGIGLKAAAEADRSPNEPKDEKTEKKSD